MQNLKDVTSAEELELGLITSLTMDDPYGNFRTKYKDHNGNNIAITMTEFYTSVKGKRGKKWAHMIMPKAE